MNYQELAQKLKPYIIEWKLQTSVTNVVSTSVLPTSIPWSNINFAGSSLADISNRTHSLLSNLSNDDHTQYVMQAGRAGYALVDTVLRTRQPGTLNYRSDHFVNAGVATINAYDDTLSAYLPFDIDSATIALRPSANSSLATTITSTGAITAAPNTTTTHQFGYADIGEMSYGSTFAGFAYAGLNTAGNYALLQSNAGNTFVNASAGQSVSLRQGNLDRLSISSVGTWYSGMSVLNTDNYASQVSGLHLGYDGSIDARYIYTDQLHAKAFIADLEQALAGGQIISKSVTIVDQAFTAPYPAIAALLTVKDLPSAPGMQVFQANDYIRLRQFSRASGGLDISDCWGTVTSPTDNGNKTQTWTFTRTGTATYSAVTFVSANSSTGTSTSVIVSKPTSTALADVMICGIATTAAVTITPPSGWLLLKQQSATNVILNIYQKLAGASEPSTYTFSFSSSVNYAAGIESYRNCDAAYYIDDVNAVGNNSATTSMPFPGGTPQTTADMYLVIGGVGGNVRSTPPAAMTERIDAGTGAVGIYAAELLLSSGANPGTKTATLATSATSAAVSVLLIPSHSALSTTAGQMQPFTVVAPDAIVLDYGVSGNGYAEVNAIDGIYGANSPYYQIVTWATHPTNATVRMRLGNLVGLGANINGSGLSPSGYGLFTDNAFLSGVLVAGGGFVTIDSNGTNINTQGDVTWSLSAGSDNISLSNYQSYSFGDPGYFGGVAGGKATNRDRVVIYNQQRYVDKTAEVIIDARQVTHDTLGVPTYSRDATVTLAASRWLPDSGVVAAASVVIKSTTSAPTTSITMNGDTIAAGELSVTGASSETAKGVDNIRAGVVGGTPRVIFEDATYTQWEMDNSAGSFRIFNPGAVKLTLDTSGNMVLSGTVKTTLGSAWDLGGYTTTAPGATGYVTIKIGGTTYKLLAST